VSFKTRLSKTIETNGSLLCVGLDVDNKLVPTEKIFEFNKNVIDSTNEYCSSYKLNLSFYESFGAEGYKAMEQTIAYIKENMPDKLLIADGKRGDIPSTMTKVAAAHFDTWGFDCTTANIWGGFESIQPLLQYENKGVFIWAKSSNSGSKDIQDIKTNYKYQKNYELIIESSIKYNLSENIGLIIGATSPDDLSFVRSMSADIPILCPGIGAQSGNLEQCIKNGIAATSINLLINASRSIIYSSPADHTLNGPKTAAQSLNSQINALLKSIEFN